MNILYYVYRTKSFRNAISAVARSGYLLYMYILMKFQNVLPNIHDICISALYGKCSNIFVNHCITTDYGDARGCDYVSRTSATNPFNFARRDAAVHQRRFLYGSTCRKANNWYGSTTYPESRINNSEHSLAGSWFACRVWDVASTVKNGIR